MERVFVISVLYASLYFGTFSIYSVIYEHYSFTDVAMLSLEKIQQSSCEDGRWIKLSVTTTDNR